MTSDWAEPRETRDERNQGAHAQGTQTQGAHAQGGYRKKRRSQSQRRTNSDKPMSDASRKEQNSKAADGGYAKCLAAGVRLLAGREYSRLELANKLSRRFSAEVTNAVVEELESLKVLDDQRYGEAFCRSRVERGYGPGYIARELEQNGLNADMIDALLELYSDQWFDRALAQAQKAHRPKRLLPQHQIDPREDSEFVGDDESWGGGAASSHDIGSDTHWREVQKARGRLARLLARRGFSGGLASKVVEQVLREANTDVEADSDFF